MQFNSLPFLWFFTAFFLVYWLLKGRARLWFCLIASDVFYSFWDWRFLGLLWFSTLFDFYVAQKLYTERDDRRRGRLLVASMSVNLGLLGFFKYFNFFIASAQSVAALAGWPGAAPMLKVILPVGISFYTFQTMSYALDVYRREIEPERDLLTFATSVALFVHLVAGPIVRARHLLPQLRTDRVFDVEFATGGFEQALRGLFKKVVVADSLAPLVDVWFYAPSQHDGLSLLLAVYFYAFQIYCDFSGYTDIALGCAKTLGYDLGVNFNRPYLATSLTDFWRRWHISLSSWLRDYLYIPLGGNRHGAVATRRNLMLTMLIGGLWHGANWTFVVWGGLHGMCLVAQPFVQRALTAVAARLRLPGWVRSLVAGLLVFHLVAFAWIFFRAPTFTIAGQMITGIATRFTPSFAQVQAKFPVFKGIALIAILIAVEWASQRPAVLRRFTLSPALRYAMAVLMLWGVFFLGTFSGNTFIYFQF